MAVFSMRDLSRRLDLGSGEATELIAVWSRWKCKHRVRDEVESLWIQPVWQLLRFIFFVIYFEYLFGWTSVYVSVLVCVFTRGHKGKAAGGLLLCVFWAIGMRPPLRSWFFFQRGRSRCRRKCLVIPGTLLAGSNRAKVIRDLHPPRRPQLSVRNTPKLPLVAFTSSFLGSFLCAAARPTR